MIEYLSQNFVYIDKSFYFFKLNTLNYFTELICRPQTWNVEFSVVPAEGTNLCHYQACGLVTVPHLYHRKEYRKDAPKTNFDKEEVQMLLLLLMQNFRHRLNFGLSGRGIAEYQQQSVSFILRFWVGHFLFNYYLY